MTILQIDIRKDKPGFSMNMQVDIRSQVTGILGASGAGKTTLLRILSGLEKPDHGKLLIKDKVVFDSTDKTNLSPQKRNIGYVFQDGKLFPHLNVEKNLKYGIKGDISDSLFDELVDLLQISVLLKKRISDISGGQAQRVAIGRAILSSPELLLFDEPFSALDKRLRQQIISMLKPIIEKFQIPTLVVSHDLSDLLMLTDQLLLIKDGRNVGYGNYHQLVGKTGAVELLTDTGLDNHIESKIAEFLPEKGLIVLNINGNKIFAEPWSGFDDFDIQSNAHVSILPEEITLALHRIEDISMQNQLEGTIEQILIIDNKVLCIIDHGFKLIAEVTLATKNKMKLKEGRKIWSLFKAASIKLSHQ